MTEHLVERLLRFVVRPRDEAAPVPSSIRLVVGLGNPGREYAGNRHNVGYWTLNRLARKHGLEFDTGGQAALARGRIAEHNVALAKTRTYMNESGKAVWGLVKRLELDDARELLVVYDDLDLPVGKVRLRAKGGAGGQKGIRSIIDATASDQFPRIRIGIGRPVVRGKPSYDPDAVAAYVLSDPPAHERDLLEEAVERAADAIEAVVAEGLEAAMARFN